MEYNVIVRVYIQYTDYMELHEKFEETYSSYEEAEKEMFQAISDLSWAGTWVVAMINGKTFVNREIGE
jgi:hypothetical protein